MKYSENAHRLIHVGGSVDGFVALMNAKARTLGLTEGRQYAGAGNLGEQVRPVVGGGAVHAEANIHARGAILRFTRKRLSGSYFVLSATSRP